MSKQKNHNCPYCDRWFTRPYRLNDHISFSHTDEKKYWCSTCSKNFSCKDKLKHHISVKHENDNNKKSNSKTKYKPENTEELKCNYEGCSKVFANKYNVKRHIENVHLKLKRKSLEKEKNDQENNQITENEEKSEDITTSSSINSSELAINSLIDENICKNNNNNNIIDELNNNNQNTEINKLVNDYESKENNSSIMKVNLPLSEHDLNESIVPNLNQSNFENQLVASDKNELKSYACARCPEILNSSNLLRRHVSDMHSKEYECCICNISYTNRFTFLKHKYFHLNYNNLNSIKNTSLYDFNTLYKRYLMNTNIFDTQNQSFKSNNIINELTICNMCCKCFSTNKKLILHRKKCQLNHKKRLEKSVFSNRTVNKTVNKIKNLQDMSLWADKHKPKNLTSLDFHKEQAEQLKKLVNSGDFPHMLFYGPNSSGKKTRVFCLLRELYGNGVDKLRIEREEFETPSKKRIEITTIASNYHIEINPSDAGIYDRIVIQESIKNIAQTNQIDLNSQKSFKVIIITEVDNLTKDAQHALRRTMEKYASTCRLILCCASTSKVIPAIRSRCLCIKVPAPSNDEICNILKQTCKLEGLQLPNELAQKIALRSNRNVRRALLMCEALYTMQYPFTNDQEICEPDWEQFIHETARIIIQQQNVEKITLVRERLYELLCHCIPSDTIFKTLTKELLNVCDTEIKPDVVALAANYQHQMNLGDKQIFYLEAFVIKFMAMYKRFIEKSLADCF